MKQAFPYNAGIMDVQTRVTFGIEAGLNLVISGALNALCAWLLFGGAQFVPVVFWNTLIETTITCYLVSVITALFATASAKRYLRRGLRVTMGAKWKRRLGALPAAAFPMGCCLFGMCLPVLIAAFGIAFGVGGIAALAPAQFIVFKALWGGLYGAFACIVILLRHLATEDAR